MFSIYLGPDTLRALRSLSVRGSYEQRCTAHRVCDEERRRRNDSSRVSKRTNHSLTLAAERKSALRLSTYRFIQY